MKNTAVIGAQWGDEGKGKITNRLAAKYDVVARFAGGDNAGHTVVFDNQTVKLHLIPSGIFFPEKINLLGSGMVVNLKQLVREIEDLQKMGFECKNLRIARNAHLIFPFHRWVDGRQEDTRKGDMLGTTRRGIGPAYSDKISRCGIRAGDLMYPEHFRRKLEKLLRRWFWMLGETDFEVETIYREFIELGKFIAPMLVDPSLFLHQAMKDGKSVLFEGAQAVLLDVDWGTYPYVTSSNCVTGGILTGLGVDPRKIGHVMGITKAYTTRVGTGPFPTENSGEIGTYLLRAGNEYGTTTGRPRRCGWLDLVMLRYACRVSSINSLSLMKLDVLSGIEKLKVCTGYVVDNQNQEHFPIDEVLQDRCAPLYRELDGWNTDLTNIKNFRQLPGNAKRYVRFIEEFCGVPVDLISVGPDRDQTIIRKNKWK